MAIAARGQSNDAAEAANAARGLTHTDATGERLSNAAGAGDCPDFDRLAGLYRWMEFLSFGPWLQRCRFAWLDRLSGCRSALVLGDGDGRFTARLLGENPAVTIDAIDASPAMLHALLRRAGENAGRVTPHVGDARLWQPAGKQYDLVVTHFFLDCLTTNEVGTLAGEVRNATDGGALWVVSEFAVPRSTFGHLVAAPVVAFLYRAFGWLTGLRVRNLPDYAAALGAAGFAVESRREWLNGLLVSELWTVAPRSRSGAD